MSEPPRPSISEALERLFNLAREVGPFRDTLRMLARAILDTTELPAAASGALEPVNTPEPASVDPEPVAKSAPPPEVPEERPLSIRDFVFQPFFGEPKSSTPPPVVVDLSARMPGPPADPEQIALQCQLKADAVRWRVKRSIQQGSANHSENDSDPEYLALIERARQVQCFLWMVREESGLGRDPISAEQLAGCFEATAHTAHLAAQAMSVRERLRDEFLLALELFAEAQSALRVAVRIFHPQGDDDAQLAAFLWLKHATSAYQFYVRRHMKVDDPGDPAQWADIVRRVHALETGVLAVAKRSGQSKKLLGKLRHKVSVILENPEDHTDDWRILAETVDQLVLGGMPPSSLEIRDPLLPLIDHFPLMDQAHPGFERVLREIERYLANQPIESLPTAPRIDPLVEKAGRLVEGRSVLLIGGVPNPAAQKALRAALHLREVYWPETREHQSISSFESDIARPDVCLVLLAIRWSSHSFGDVKHWCDQHDKPLVRLPRGYNSSQVAKEILEQASERLHRGAGV